MKKQKIVITGGLGYIGSELCKLYSGETRFKNIIITDSRFVSERVKQLRDWGFEFIQCSILDKDKMQELLSDADIVHHLAGVTDVAYVKTESNSEQDKKIIETAIVGTDNIINSIPKDCKLIFPSTHVVYEGFSETKFDIDEAVETCPILTYATSKVQNENEAKSLLSYMKCKLYDFDGNIVTSHDTTYNSNDINNTLGAKNRFFAKFDNGSGYFYVMLTDNGVFTTSTNYSNYDSRVNDYIYND